MDDIDFIKNLVNIVPGNRNSGDYIKDGLLYCYQCHTPKQYRLKDPDTGTFITIVPVMCSCAKERYVLDRHKEHVRQLKDFCFKRMPGFKDTLFDLDIEPESKASKVSRQYVKNFDLVNGLLLCGDVGTGKTFYAACIANALIENGISVIMTNLPNLIDLEQNERKYTLAGMSTCDVVVLDDLGVERNTSYANEIVYNIVNSLYASDVRLIVTTNLSASEMSKTTDLSHKRIFDRILQRCYPVAVTGNSKRIQLGRERTMKERQLLEGECK